MTGNISPQEFRPEPLSRKGEVTAWVLALLVGSAWLVLFLTRNPVFAGLPILEGFLLLAGLGISLSNWMDRHTILRLLPSGVIFDNGLRHAELNWNQIRQVQVFPSNWGKKVRVIGENSHFDFRTLGEVKVHGNVKGRMGFAHGQMILKRIIEAADLKRVESSDSGENFVHE